MATAFCTKETPWNTVHGIYLPGHGSALTHTDDIYTGSDCPLKVSPPAECPPRVQPPQQAVLEHEPYASVFILTRFGLCKILLGRS